MSERDDEAPEPSLIQQRIALRRRRAITVFAITLQLLGLALLVAVLALGEEGWLTWALAGLVVVGLAYNAYLLTRVHQDTIAFEHRRGTGAGEQP